jgi:hypothetical protein
MTKVGVRNRVEAIRIADERGWLDLTPAYRLRS